MQILLEGISYCVRGTPNHTSIRRCTVIGIAAGIGFQALPDARGTLKGVRRQREGQLTGQEREAIYRHSLWKKRYQRILCCLRLCAHYGVHMYISEEITESTPARSATLRFHTRNLVNRSTDAELGLKDETSPAQR